MLKLRHCTSLLVLSFIVTSCATTSDLGTYVPIQPGDFYTPSISLNQPAEAEYVSSHESDNSNYINAMNAANASIHTSDQRRVSRTLSPDYY